MYTCWLNWPVEGPAANYALSIFGLVFNNQKRENLAKWLQNLRGNTENYTDFILSDSLYINQKTVE